MKANLFIAVILLCFACSKGGVDNVSINPGSIELSFLNNGSPVANAEVRVTRDPYSNYSSEVIINETTNSDGSINFNELNYGSYYFRIDLGTNGYLFESFEILSGTSSSRTFEISDYSSSVAFSIDNITSFNLDNFNFYLVPNSLDVEVIEADKVKANSILGSIVEGEINFNSVVNGNYALYANSGDEFVRLRGVEIQHDYDFQSEVTLPASLLLTNQVFSIDSTLNSIDNVVDDHIQSISFTATEMTLTDIDGNSFTTAYRTGLIIDPIQIFTENDYPDNLNGIHFIQSNAVSDGTLIFVYQEVFPTYSTDYTAYLN